MGWTESTNLAGKGDMCSFGIIIVEIISRRSPRIAQSGTEHAAMDPMCVVRFRSATDHCGSQPHEQSRSPPTGDADGFESAIFASRSLANGLWLWLTLWSPGMFLAESQFLWIFFSEVCC